MIRRAFSLAALALLALPVPPSLAQSPSSRRPVVGVALGGGSALGLAHVGVLRWLEEHRIPIDVVTGTSMGGLVGGAYATGLSPDELSALIAATDWAELFGASNYRHRTVARKEDLRAYPARIGLELRRGAALPPSLNDGQQVEFFLARLAAPYAGVASFDSLPTRFRTVAVDLRSAERVVLAEGSLARALRATMSLPGIFPPVELGDRLLVDGGFLDNVPAGVARDMGADVVIAVNVGKLPDRRRVRTELFSLLGATANAMMRVSTRKGLAEADVIVNPTLDRYGRFDWTLGVEMAAEGYRAAESVRAQLVRYAVDESTWRAHQARREAKRRAALPVVDAIQIGGATTEDRRRLQERLAPLLGRPMDFARVQQELVRLAARDRYETVWWDLARVGEAATLIVHAQPRANAPPIGMFAVNVQNVTSDDFTFQFATRLLALDVGAADAQLRLDLALGSRPHLGAEWRRPIGGDGLFVALGAIAARLRRSLARDDAVVAQYDQREAVAQAELGFAGGSTWELRGGVRAGHTDLRARVGDPDLPSLHGPEAQLRLQWIHDAQTHHITPASGLRLVGRTRWVVAAPAAVLGSREWTSEGVVQAELQGSRFWPARQRRDRVFLTGAVAATLDGEPLPTDQFPLGLPMRLDGYGVGERRGEHAAALTVGYLYGLAWLPEFFGGAVYAGTWLQNGSAFDELDDARLETQLGAGFVIETLVGPALFGVTAGVHGERRMYFGFGRIFP